MPQVPESLVWKKEGLSYGDWNMGENSDSIFEHSTQFGISSAVQSNSSVFIHSPRLFLIITAMCSVLVRGFSPRSGQLIEHRGSTSLWRRATRKLQTCLRVKPNRAWKTRYLHSIENNFQQILSRKRRRVAKQKSSPTGTQTSQLTWYLITQPGFLDRYRLKQSRADSQTHLI